jgi:hypothetical protein
MKSGGGVARSSGGIATETGDLHRWCLWDCLKENLYAATLLAGYIVHIPVLAKVLPKVSEKLQYLAAIFFALGPSLTPTSSGSGGHHRRRPPAIGVAPRCLRYPPVQIPLPLIHASVGFGLILSSERRRRRRVNCNPLLSTIMHS